MSRNNSTMITPSRERGQHLKFEDRVSIKIYRKLKYTLRAIAEVLIVLRLPLCMKSSVAQAKGTAQEAAFLNTIQAEDKQTMR